MFAKMLLVSGKSYNGNLTSPLGLQMAEFPLPPMFAKMLLVSGMSKWVLLRENLSLGFLTRS